MHNGTTLTDLMYGTLVPFKGPKKYRAPSERIDFEPGSFTIIELAPFSDLAG
jgi:hypothetical protein